MGVIRMSNSEHCDGKDGGVKDVENWRKFWKKYPFGAGITFLILAHPVYKMWVIQEPNKLALWNKLHFEEKTPESIERV